MFNRVGTTRDATRFISGWDFGCLIWFCFCLLYIKNTQILISRICKTKMFRKTKPTIIDHTFLMYDVFNMLSKQRYKINCIRKQIWMEFTRNKSKGWPLMMLNLDNNQHLWCFFQWLHAATLSSLRRAGYPLILLTVWLRRNSLIFRPIEKMTFQVFAREMH